MTPLETATSSGYPGTSGGYRLEVTLPQHRADALIAEFAARNTLPGVSIIMQIG